MGSLKLCLDKSNISKNVKSEINKTADKLRTEEWKPQEVGEMSLQSAIEKNRVTIDNIVAQIKASKKKKSPSKGKEIKITDKEKKVIEKRKATEMSREKKAKDSKITATAKEKTAVEKEVKPEPAPNSKVPVDIPTVLPLYGPATAKRVDRGEGVKVNVRNLLERLRDRSFRAGQTEFKIMMDFVLNKIDPQILDELKFYIDDTIENRGEYLASEHEIRIKKDATYKTVLHEAIHAITARQIYLNPKYGTKIKSLYKEFMDQRTKTEYAYGITNEHEFLSEAISNGNFRNELRAIPSKQNPEVSIFKKVQNFIVDVFTKKPAERNMLHDAMDAVFAESEYIEKKVSDRGVISRQQKARKGSDITREDYKVEPEADWETIDKENDELYLTNNINSTISTAGKKVPDDVKNKELEGSNEIARLIFNDLLSITYHSIGALTSIKDRLNNLGETDGVGGKLKALSKRTIRELEGHIDSFDVQPEAEIAESTWFSDAARDRNVAMKARKLPSTPKQILSELKDNTAPIIKTGPKDFLKSASDLLKKLGMGLTERLRLIDPRLIKYLRQMEMNISIENIKAAKVIKPFAEFYKSLSKDDRMILDWSLKNNDAEALAVRKDIMGDKFQEIPKLLERIHGDMGAVGLNNFSSIDEYFPRKVKDPEGLMQFLRSRKDIKAIEKATGRELTAEEKKSIQEERASLSLLEEALLDAEDKKGSKLTHLEKNEITNAILNTGRYNPISFNIPGSAKQRGIRRVSPEMNKYYEDSLDTLISHIYESNEAIQTRKAFNFTDRKQKIRAGNKLAKEFTRLTRRGEDTAEVEARLEQVSEDLAVLDNNVEDGITQFLSEEGIKLPTDKQKEVVEILRARLNQRGTSGAISTIRNAMLITTLGNPTSAITQLGDLAWSIYDNGFTNTVSSMFGSKRMKRTDFDLERSMKEFNNGSSKYVDSVLKWSGLQHMDLFGKEAYMEASLKKAEKMSKENFIKSQKHVFGEESGDVWQKIQDKNYKDDEGHWDRGVMYYVFNSLSNVQPISLSEMPEGYLVSGQGRIFYTLKTYQIKAFNNIIREAKKPGAKGKANAVKLVGILVLAGATADELKDLLMGRTNTFSDQLHENLLKLGFLSKYALKKKQTVKTVAADMIVPPLRLVDSPMSDMWQLIHGEPAYESLKLLPWGGLAFTKTEAGVDKTLANERTDILEDLRGDLEAGKSLKGVRRRVKAHNKKAKGTENKIDFMKSRRSAQRRIKEDR